LIDEFAELMANQPDSQLVEICRRGINPVVSRVPFSHLVASYQASLKDADKTVELVKRTGYEVGQSQQILKDELKYIDQWLKKWAPDEVKFELAKQPPKNLDEASRKFLADLATKIANAPADADGEWFHKVIYDTGVLEPTQKF